jgi:hypothetical protein
VPAPNVRSSSSDDSPYWLEADEAEGFYQAGAGLLRNIHESRPTIGESDSINLNILDTDSFDAYTTFAQTISTIHLSRGWIIYAYEALIGASMKEEWPTTLVTIGGVSSANKQGGGQPNPELEQVAKFLSSIDLAELIFRFVYLHEFYHAALGHTRFLADKLGARAFATIPSNMPSGDISEFRKIRTAFELEADACALKTLIFALYKGEFDTLFSSKGIGVLGISFVVELAYLLNLEMIGESSTRDWGSLFRFDEPGVYPHPVKRRFFLLAKLVSGCRTSALASALEDGFDYGASVARVCYRMVTKSGPHRTLEGSKGETPDLAAERRVLEIARLGRIGEAMIDPQDWIRHQDAILRRVRGLLSHTETPWPYEIALV